MTKIVATLLLALLAGCAEPARSVSTPCDPDEMTDGGADAGGPGRIFLVEDFLFAALIPSRCSAFGGRVPTRLELGATCESPTAYPGVLHCLTSEGVADSVGGFVEGPGALSQSMRVVCWIY